MSLSADVLDALLAAGATAEMIVAAVKADMLEHERAVTEKRAKDADRQRRHRMSRNVTQCHSDTADTLDKEVSPHTPLQEINPNLPPIVPQIDPVPGAVAEWNAMAGRHGLAKVAKVTGRRRAAIRKRIDEFGAERWSAAVAAVGKSQFCCGDNDRGWQADIDFIASEAGFVKIIEGKFAPKVREASNAIQI